MTGSINGSVQPLSGVVTVPTMAIHESIQRHVTESLKGVEPGRTMAVLSIHTEKGVNLAIAHKFNDQWNAVLWVGKSGWDKPLSRPDGGVSISYSR